MLRPRIKKIVRQFAENGMKLLLENPHNVRELLELVHAKHVDLIDFDRMTRVPATFVQRDYRHVEADLVLRAPLRTPGKRKGKELITIYVLIEHQSEPDRMMVFRALEYVVQIYKSQIRDWRQRHGSMTGLRLQPVLPVVFYTGTRRWDSLGQLADVVEMGQEFSAMIPTMTPLFLNLSLLTPDELENPTANFSWVLRLVQQCHVRPSEFQELVRRVVDHLQAMSLKERMRWLELISYIQALVYHDRSKGEHATLQEEIVASVAAPEFRQEVSAMGQTMAEALMEKGRKEGTKKARKEEAVRARQQILLEQLRERFRDLPEETAAVIESCKNVQELDSWLRQFATASTLEDVGIGK